MREVGIGYDGEVSKAMEASSLLEQFIGMRGRSEGKMLFDFPFSREWRIDNVLVRTRLYLYFLDSGGKVLETGSLPPGMNPLGFRVYRPSEPASMLLESSEELDLDEGDRIDLAPGHQ